MSGPNVLFHISFTIYLMSSSETIRSNVSRASPENLLLRGVAGGDRDALTEIYARFQRPLFRYLFHLLGQKESAEDVLQQVMVIVWQKAHTFQATGQAASWLFGIAHNQAYKVLRKNSSPDIVELEAAIEVQDEAPGPEAEMLRNASHEEIAGALSRLSPEHREVLELTFFHDFACKEIATIVGIPFGTVKSRLSYARRALKVTLLDNGWEE